MAEDKIRVDFTAPKFLAERAGSIIKIPNISRTHLLIDALKDELKALVADEGSAGS